MIELFKKLEIVEEKGNYRFRIIKNDKKYYDFKDIPKDLINGIDKNLLNKKHCNDPKYGQFYDDFYQLYKISDNKIFNLILSIYVSSYLILKHNLKEDHVIYTDRYYFINDLVLQLSNRNSKKVDKIVECFAFKNELSNVYQILDEKLYVNRSLIKLEKKIIKNEKNTKFYVTLFIYMYMVLIWIIYYFR